jgi:hypothetical protein
VVVVRRQPFQRSIVRTLRPRLVPFAEEEDFPVDEDGVDMNALYNDFWNDDGDVSRGGDRFVLPCAASLYADSDLLAPLAGTVPRPSRFPRAVCVP